MVLLRNSVQERALRCLWVVLPGASTASPAVMDRDQWLRQHKTAVLWPWLALVGQQQPRRRSSLLLLVPLHR